MADEDREAAPRVVCAQSGGGGAGASGTAPGRQPRIWPRHWRLIHHGAVLLVLAVAAGLWAAVIAMTVDDGGAAGAARAASWVRWGGALLALGLAVAALGVRVRRWLHGQWPDASAAPARLLLYCVMGAWTVLVLLGKPVNASRLIVAAAVALAVFAAAVLVPRPRREGWVGRLLVGLDLVLLNLCVLAIAGEIGLRVAAARRPSVLLRRPVAGVEKSLEALRYPPGTVRYGFPVNSGGHYDEEFVAKHPGQRRVVCIGDSFSAGVVHHSFHFTTVAERLLDGVAIDNMGLPAIDLPHYQLLLEREALTLDPDAVVVNLFVGNDLSWPLPAPGRAPRLQGLFDSSNLLVFEVPRRLLILSRQGRRAREALEDRAGRGAEEGVLRSRKEILERYPWYDDPLIEPPTLDRQPYLAIERQRAVQLCVDQPRKDFALRLERLEEMRKAARDVPLAVMIIPDVFQVDDRLWSEIAPRGANREQRMRSVGITRHWLEEHSFPYLDLLPVLRAVRPLADGERHLYKLNDSHLNARGNAVVGRALAAFLARWPADHESVGSSPTE